MENGLRHLPKHRAQDKEMENMREKLTSMKGQYLPNRFLEKEQTHSKK